MALSELYILVDLQSWEEPAKQLTKCRIRCDNADMNSITFTLNQICHPFSISAPADLVNISSGKAANEGIKKFLLGTLERGRNCDSNLIYNSQVFKPVARTKVLNFRVKNKVNVVEGV